MYDRVEPRGAPKRQPREADFTGRPGAERKPLPGQLYRQEIKTTLSIDDATLPGNAPASWGGHLATPTCAELARAWLAGAGATAHPCISGRAYCRSPPRQLLGLLTAGFGGPKPRISGPPCSVCQHLDDAAGYGTFESRAP